ncbi:TIGR00266 family protein [Halobacteriovorax sp. GB3]|uniref:TIGR00266 family protein n=1 Tax=Halobacteriovorax sp. GB3 TaxID=2719615 RepID=UPI00235E39B0|nr:TIGR00266 family protein [Halobacteriovorax sp. GB3]MDD0851836.1 TIGR00266 family protein [Halobacteriovorax sp. GB3]
MKVDIQYRPSNTAAKITLNTGEECTTEAGSMISMSSGLTVETTTHKKGKGSLLKSLKRAFAGESFFLNHYDSTKENSELWISSHLPGDMCEVQLNGVGLVVQSSSFMACSKNIDLDTGWQGFKTLLSGEGLFWLKLSGSGNAVLNSFGSIYCVDVEDEYIVDSGHIVAFEETLNFKISKAGSSWLHSFMGGEGFVCRFQGKGKIWCQSHNPSSFGHSLTPYLRPKKR